ncbi:MAG: hypothetical protein USCAAHI_01022 [Beijerinckiaceae bacterium]|jgi:hypothetical protein|nr:MAG: hypothetical protein USCAAHI_01022 [Beijerinckiaceae bacterium]
MAIFLPKPSLKHDNFPALRRIARDNWPDACYQRLKHGRDFPRLALRV